MSLPILLLHTNTWNCLLAPFTPVGTDTTSWTLHLALTPSSVPTAAATYCCILLLSTTTTLSYGKYNYYCCHLQLPFAPLLLLPSLQLMPPLPPLVLPAAFHSCLVLLNRPPLLTHMLLRYCIIHRRSQKAFRPRVPVKCGACALMTDTSVSGVLVMSYTSLSGGGD